jgi:hypothetical protein
VADPKQREAAAAKAAAAAAAKAEAAKAEAQGHGSGGQSESGAVGAVGDGPAPKRPKTLRKTAPRPCSLAFSRDASLLFSAQSDNSLLVFNAQTSKLVNSFRQLREGVALVQVRFFWVGFFFFGTRRQGERGEVGVV